MLNGIRIIRPTICTSNSFLITLHICEIRTTRSILNFSFLYYKTCSSACNWPPHKTRGNRWSLSHNGLYSSAKKRIVSHDKSGRSVISTKKCFTRTDFFFWLSLKAYNVNYRPTRTQMFTHQSRFAIDLERSVCAVRAFVLSRWNSKRTHVSANERDRRRLWISTPIGRTPKQWSQRTTTNNTNQIRDTPIGCRNWIFQLGYDRRTNGGPRITWITTPKRVEKKKSLTTFSY